MLESISPTLRALALSLALGAGLVATPLLAKEAAPVAVNEQVEARMMALANELRCLVCQNQTIADSHADLALDLRQQIREMIAKGDSDRQILDYMTARYGDFVLYRPPFKATTALLWAGPAVLLLMAMGLLFIVLRRRSRLGADAYDPDPSEVNR
jgi:cytochrome c-type biogenesis protein CcmH